MNEPFDNHEDRHSGGTALVDEPRRREPTPVTSPEKLFSAPPPKRPRRQEDEEEDESFFQRNKLGIIVGILVVLGGVWLLLRKPSAPSQPVRKVELTVVRIQLPPPPPPPKVPPPPPKEDKRVEQTPMAKPEPKPEAPQAKLADKPPEGLGTNNKGPGPGMAGLGNSGNGMLGGTGSKGGGGGGSITKWYAGQVGSKIAEGLRTNRKTRSSNMRVDVQVWVDGTGRITRATLNSSSGDSSLDSALTNEILPGIKLSEPPPPNMRMPIPLRLTARRPN